MVMGLEAADCLLVGDRLETDIRMGGMRDETAVVMTAVTARRPWTASPVRPRLRPCKASPIWNPCS